MTDQSAPTRGEVTQGDREAAAEILKFAGMWSLSRKVRQGKADDNLTVDLVAAHRLSAIEECAKAMAKVVYTGRTNVPRAELDLAKVMIDAVRNLGRGV